MKCRIAGYVMETSTDGTGLRNSIYFQGCSIHCNGCHNATIWDPHKGTKVEVSEVVDKVDTEFVSGISILGGEPTDQPHALIELLRLYKKRCPDKTIWLYTGRKLEVLQQYHKLYNCILECCDVVVDGPYLPNKEHCKFRGSPNQRIIKIVNHEPIYPT